LTSFIFNAGEVTANGMLPVAGTAAEKEIGIPPGPPALSNPNGREFPYPIQTEEKTSSHKPQRATFCFCRRMSCPMDV
jgi:hypothetical protein